MKSIITLLFIVFCGVTATANINDHSVALNPKIESYGQIQFTQVASLLDSGIIVATKFSEVETATKTEVARLYKFKNSRIKKALAFKTKRNKAKMA